MQVLGRASPDDDELVAALVAAQPREAQAPQPQPVPRLRALPHPDALLPLQRGHPAAQRTA